MDEEDFGDKLTNDQTAQVGGGMLTVGAFGKTALITKGICAATAAKGGVILGGFLAPHIAIGAGAALIVVGIIKYLRKKKQ